MSIAPSWEIWVEGNRGAPYETWPARKLGESTGATFREACVRFFAENNDRFIDSAYPLGAQQLFSAERLTFWANRLFDNARDARRLNG